VVRFIQTLRQRKLTKTPGVAETLDWAAALLALGTHTLDPDTIARTLGCVLKSTEDITLLNAERIEQLLTEALREEP